MTTRAATANPAELPAELAGSVPRDVRLTGGGIALAALAVAVAVGALAAGIVMSVIYVRSGDAHRIRERDSIVAAAEVVEVVVRRGEEPRRQVTYRYEAHGHSYTGRTRLRKSDRRVLRRGDPVQIGLVPSHPEESWLIGYPPSGFPLWLIPLTVMFLLALAFLLAWNVRRQWTLLSEGRVARARVTEVKKVSSDKGKSYRVSYEFKTLSGATHTARCEIGKAPAIGATIPVVYHRDQPEWTAMYPMKLVRPGRLVS